MRGRAQSGLAASAIRPSVKIFLTAPDAGSRMAELCGRRGVRCRSSCGSAVCPQCGKWLSLTKPPRGGGSGGLCALQARRVCRRGNSVFGPGGSGGGSDARRCSLTKRAASRSNQQAWTLGSACDRAIVWAPPSSTSNARAANGRPSASHSHPRACAPGAGLVYSATSSDK
jgi:hypothetical protein